MAGWPPAWRSWIGWFAFGERITPVFWLGVVLILAGVHLMQLAVLRDRKDIARRRRTGECFSLKDTNKQ
jgi:drug/metabolite transporter (DMT)-like permease